MLDDRRERHAHVAATLTRRTDHELAALLASGAATVGAGGGSSVVDVDGTLVFAKRIPLTARELGQPGSTADHYGLPLSCRYGVHPLAGPGVNGWRELAANLTVTRAVLDGDAACFPLLHHWRVLPGRPEVADEHLDHDADYASMRLVNWVATTVCGIPMPTTGGPVARNAFVRRCADGDVPTDLPPAVVDVLTRHSPAAARMNELARRLFDGDSDARYVPVPEQTLRTLGGAP